MKANTACSKRLNVLGDVDRSSYRESLSAMLRQHWQKFGYYSIFATLPALLAADLQEARADRAVKIEPSVAGLPSRLSAARLNKGRGTPAWLKRQSEFRLPHQRGGFDMLAALGGADDCPGRPVPGGAYTAAAPYLDSGDTTGANNTVSRAHYIDYVYYNYDAHGPDHIYSFTLTGRGPNPQIQVTTSSGAYRPLIYVLHGGSAGPFGAVPCPAGTGNLAFNELVLSDSRWGFGNTATLHNGQMNFLPLNVPLFLFVDSRFNDASGSGAYSIRIQDVTIAPAEACPNSIDCAEFFVRQHYLDFLGREPDAAGLAFWSGGITSCGADAGCAEVRRVNTSAAFFLSIEFQETGFLAYRARKAAFGDLPGKPVPISRAEMLADVGRLGDGVAVGVGDWAAKLEANKAAYFNEFVTLTDFIAVNPLSLTAEQYVDGLFARANVLPTQAERGLAITFFGGGGTAGRAAALRSVAESQTLRQAETNKAFVLMQYFGYLRRDPDSSPDTSFDGFNFWLAKLDQFNGNYEQAEMVKAFISSTEYRQRFGQ